MALSDETVAIVGEKTEQAVEILQEKGIDLWLTLVRETSQVRDPMLEPLLGMDLTWISALLIHRSGERVAIVGRYDRDNVEHLGAYNRVIAYDQSIRRDLLEAIQGFDPQQIAINYSEDDPASDGLTHGLFRRLTHILADTPYASRLVSADSVIAAVRGRKTPTEITLIRAAVSRTEDAIDQLGRILRPGMTDLEIADFLHHFLEENGYGSSWAWDACPVVTVGPESSFGHGMPSGLKTERGNLVHIDFGISRHGFVSDLQRTWYLAEHGEAEAPPDVTEAWDAVTSALEAGRAALKPGAKGWEVDAAARETLIATGYPEFMHAYGHQVGRTAHDGATVLGPKWDRYGSSIEGEVEVGNVFAIELGVKVEGRGYVSREENIVIEDEGAVYLSTPQPEVWVL